MSEDATDRTDRAIQQSADLRQRLQQMQQQLQDQYDSLQEREHNLAQIEKPKRAAHPKSHVVPAKRVSMDHEAAESAKVLDSIRDLSQQIQDMEEQETHLRDLQSQYKKRTSSANSFSSC